MGFLEDQEVRVTSSYGDYDLLENEVKQDRVKNCSTFQCLHLTNKYFLTSNHCTNKPKPN